VSVVFPEAVKAQGNTSVTVVQTVADMSAPKLATEINHASSVNVSCYLYGDINPTIATAKGEAPRRLCTTEVFQQFGNTTFEVPDLQYVYDPQGDPTDEANEALTALTEGSEVFLVIRRGMNARTSAYATGQNVDVWHVRLGPQNRTVTGDGEFDEYAITQSVIPLEPPEYSAAIVT
jgi:cystathionine beta-lyase/cystathionine gamma-synthase